MSIYWGLSFAEIKIECRRYGISTYAKKKDLEQKLVEALVKGTKDTLQNWAASTTTTSYPAMTLADLKAELKTRKLPVSGTKDTLVSRLRDADWKDWDLRLQTFPQFAKLPVEIQEYIWNYSLPGPRILASVHTGFGGPNGLYFPKVDHTPNPAALSTCQLSRKIALKRYRLVFGTDNMYADLEGGDILYISPFGRKYSLDPSSLWECDDQGNDPAATIISDLKKVTHLLLPYSLLDLYRFRQTLTRGLDDHHNPGLQRNLPAFRNLKTLSLCCNSFDDWITSRSPGQTIVEYDITKFKPMDAGDYWTYQPKETAVAMKTQLYKSPTEEEIARGIPECQLVEVYRLPDAPRRDLQGYKGELYTELYYDRPEEHWKG